MAVSDEALPRQRLLGRLLEQPGPWLPLVGLAAWVLAGGWQGSGLSGAQLGNADVVALRRGRHSRALVPTAATRTSVPACLAGLAISGRAGLLLGMTDGSLFNRVLRLLAWAAGTLVFLHVLGWILVAAELAGTTLYVPPIQAAIGLGLSLLVVRVAGARRRVRGTVAVSVLIVTAVAFLTVPMPVTFVDNTLMADGVQRVESRDRFERRFPLADGQVNFHSHLGDIAIISLDRFFGASETSVQPAFSALSHLAGLLFLAELLVVGTLYRWSRRACRYVGLAIGTPMASLYFGYWEVGYLAAAVGVVPLLLFRPNRGGVSTQASTMAAGALQGLHTAMHGYGAPGDGRRGTAGAARRNLRTRGAAFADVHVHGRGAVSRVDLLLRDAVRLGDRVPQDARLAAAADDGHRRRPVRGAAAVAQRVGGPEPDRVAGRHPPAGPWRW